MDVLRLFTGFRCTLSHTPHRRLLETQPQVVEVWFAEASIQAPQPLRTLHGTTSLDGPTVLWKPAINRDTLASVLNRGGRLIVRVHTGALFDEQERIFSAALDAALGLRTPHAPGGVHETWMIVSAG
jgi:hypothetical protein